MNCDCITEINKQLEPEGVELATRLKIVSRRVKRKTVNSLETFLPVPTRRIDGKKQPPSKLIEPAFCSFCGKKAEKEKPAIAGKGTKNHGK